MSIIESYKWLTPEFTITPTDGKTVKIRGKAIPRETISRNNKKYVDEELRKAARTFIDVPITENHKDWRDKKNHLGKVNWMEYDDGSMEYVAEVWNPTMASELRFYAKNPTKSQIHGVSVEADFLKIACAKCKHEFLTESDWRRHMEEVEHIHDLPLEPHGIRGRALSIVTGIESPGVVGNTLEVMESVSPLLRLLETVIKLSMEKEKMQGNTPPTPQKQAGPPYTFKEAAEPAPVKEEAPPEEKPKDEEEDEEEKKKKKMMPEDEEPVAETVTLRESANLAKLEFVAEASQYESLDACVAAGNSRKECAAMFDTLEERNNANRKVVEAYNKIVEWLNSPIVFALPKQYNDASVKESIKKVAEALAAIKPYDDKALKEQLAAIKPYDDTALKEQVAAIPKDDVSWQTTLTEQAETIKKLSETVNTQAASLTQQETQFKQDIQKLQETLTHNTEENAKVKEMYEKNLAAFEKDIKEYYKPLETRTQELEKKLTETTKELTETKSTLQETKTLAENTKDKLKPEYKGASKTVVKETVSQTSFNPYDPARTP